jgi:ABC-2 type transport system ATP-binding protein
MPVRDLAVIQVEGLRKEYGPRVALEGASFAVPAGQVCGLLGPNGAGKSTTLKILCGVLRPTAGRAAVAGFDVTRAPLEAKRRLGYVPESGAMYNLLTPREFLALVGELFALDPGLARERTDAYLRLFRLAEAADVRLEGLSKGMRQKVLIASALLHDPPVLLMDEPLNGLDVYTTRLVKDLLADRAASGKTVLYSSHVLDVVERVCQRVVILSRGRVVADAPTAELLERSHDATLESLFQSLTTTAEEQQSADALLNSFRSAANGPPPGAGA